MYTNYSVHVVSYMDMCKNKWCWNKFHFQSMCWLTLCMHHIPSHKRSFLSPRLIYHSVWRVSTCYRFTATRSVFHVWSQWLRKSDIQSQFTLIQNQLCKKDSHISMVKMWKAVLKFIHRCDVLQSRRDHALEECKREAADAWTSPTRIHWRHSNQLA